MLITMLHCHFKATTQQTVAWVATQLYHSTSGFVKNAIYVSASPAAMSDHHEKSKTTLKL